MAIRSDPVGSGFGRIARLATPYTKVYVADWCQNVFAAAAASALMSMVDGRETLGLWTFNGTSGTYACGNKLNAATLVV